MNVASSTTLVADYNQNVGDILYSVLPEVLLTAAALFGLVLVVRYFRKLVK